MAKPHYFCAFVALMAGATQPKTRPVLLGSTVINYSGISDPVRLAGGVHRVTDAGARFAGHVDCILNRTPDGS